ncbi:hypothetical protein, partial [Paraburkholderia sediminicola]|uniref:hypothetical protein n=1 Tax=Paraburkholderia sediminicola TaxID=458836 RepID=UPI0038BA5D8A
VFARPKRLPILPDRTRKYPSVETIKAHISDRVASRRLDLLSLYSDSGAREYTHSTITLMLNQHCAAYPGTVDLPV